jgi:uncharacterized protein (TIGR03067 family)
MLHTALLLLLAADPKAAPDLDKEVTRLQGTWECVGAEADGMALDDAARRDRSEGGVAPLGKMVVLKNTVHFYLFGSEQGLGEPAEYELDVSARPPAITFRLTKDDPNTKYAVYELKGDTLRVCVHGKEPENADKKPKAVKTAKDDGLYLYVFKRAK